MVYLYVLIGSSVHVLEMDFHLLPCTDVYVWLVSVYLYKMKWKVTCCSVCVASYNYDYTWVHTYTALVLMWYNIFWLYTCTVDMSQCVYDDFHNSCNHSKSWYLNSCCLYVPATVDHYTSHPWLTKQEFYVTAAQTRQTCVVVFNTLIFYVYVHYGIRYWNTSALICDLLTFHLHVCILPHTLFVVLGISLW